MQLVGRADALALDCLRHAVGAVSEHAIHAAGELRSLPVHGPLGRPGRESPTLPASTRDLRLLPLPGRAATARGARLEPGSAARYALSGWTSSQSAAGRPPQPRAAASAALGAAIAAQRSSVGSSRRWLRRRLRDGSRVAAPRQPRRRVFSTVDTVGIPLMLSTGPGRCAPPLVYVAIGLPERLARLRSRAHGRLYARALGASAASLAYSEHEARRAPPVAGGARAAVPGRVRAVRRRRRGLRPTDAAAGRGRRLGRRRPASRLRAAPRGRPGDARPQLSRRHDGGPRALARRPPGNVSVETDLPFDEMRRRLERGADRCAPRA